MAIWISGTMLGTSVQVQARSLPPNSCQEPLKRCFSWLVHVSYCKICVVEAIKWVAARTADEVMSEREEMISCLEQAADAMAVNGLKQKWFEGTDKHTRAVAGQANGHLMSVLLEASGYCDAGCVELLREGC